MEVGFTAERRSCDVPALCFPPCYCSFIHILTCPLPSYTQERANSGNTSVVLEASADPYRLAYIKERVEVFLPVAECSW